VVQVIRLSKDEMTVTQPLGIDMVGRAKLMGEQVLLLGQAAGVMKMG
jgi:hypothetical protein